MSTGTMVDATGSARTGPLGRVARSALLVVLAGALVSLVDERGAVGLRESSVADEPGLVFVTLVMVALFVRLVGDVARAVRGDRARQLARTAASGGLAAAFALAAATGQLVSGEVWGLPLVDVVWWFDVVMLAQTIVALAVAIRLGTRGCEVGVWSELIYRARGERRPPASHVLCVVGLDLLDEWEARWRATHQRTTNVKERDVIPGLPRQHRSEDRQDAS